MSGWRETFTSFCERGFKLKEEEAEYSYCTAEEDFHDVRLRFLQLVAEGLWLLLSVFTSFYYYFYSSKGSEYFLRPPWWNTYQRFAASNHINGITGWFLSHRLRSSCQLLSFNYLERGTVGYCALIPAPDSLSVKPTQRTIRNPPFKSGALSHFIWCDYTLCWYVTLPGMNQVRMCFLNKGDTFNDTEKIRNLKLLFLHFLSGEMWNVYCFRCCIIERNVLFKEEMKYWLYR